MELITFNHHHRHHEQTGKKTFVIKNKIKERNIEKKKNVKKTDVGIDFIYLFYLEWCRQLCVRNVSSSTATNMSLESSNL